MFDKCLCGKKKRKEYKCCDECKNLSKKLGSNKSYRKIVKEYLQEVDRLCKGELNA